jgi:hypothetical protein
MYLVDQIISGPAVNPLVTGVISGVVVTIIGRIPPTDPNRGAPRPSRRRRRTAGPAYLADKMAARNSTMTLASGKIEFEEAEPWRCTECGRETLIIEEDRDDVDDQAPDLVGFPAFYDPFHGIALCDSCDPGPERTMVKGKTTKRGITGMPTNAAKPVASAEPASGRAWATKHAVARAVQIENLAALIREADVDHFSLAISSWDCRARPTKASARTLFESYRASRYENSFSEPAQKPSSTQAQVYWPVCASGLANT